MDHRFHYANQIRDVISIIVYPLQVLVSLPTDTGHWISENIATRDTLLVKNKQLHNENLQLRTKLLKMDSLEAKNQRLRALLGSSFRVGEKTLVAELLAVDMEPFSQKLIINKGASDMVYVGQSVLDANGVFGQIVEVNPFTSTVMMITDPSHGIPVEVNRNSLRAIANGIGKTDRIELLHLPNNADIEEGDLLVTSGLGGRFPAGYPVAYASKVTRTPGQPFIEVYATPTAKLDRSRELLLVWSIEAEQNPKDAGQTPSASNDKGDKK